MAVMSVRAIVYFEGGHLLATYHPPDAGAESLRACADDAVARATGWPFLWISLQIAGKQVYRAVRGEAGNPVTVQLVTCAQVGCGKTT